MCRAYTYVCTYMCMYILCTQSVCMYIHVHFCRVCTHNHVRTYEVLYIRMQITHIGAYVYPGMSRIEGGAV